MNTPYNQIEHLIAPYRKKEIRLHNALSKLSKATRLLGSFIDTLSAITVSKDIKIELFGVISVGNDVLETRPQIRLPLHPDNDLAAIYLKLHYLGISAKVPPSGSDFICDIKVSNDYTTFHTLFPPANKPTLPVGIKFIRYTKFSVDRLFDGDTLMVDVTQADGTVAGVEIRILGSLVYVPPAV